MAKPADDEFGRSSMQKGAFAPARTANGLKQVTQAGLTCETVSVMRRATEYPAACPKGCGAPAIGSARVMAKN